MKNLKIVLVFILPLFLNFNLLHSNEQTNFISNDELIVRSKKLYKTNLFIEKHFYKKKLIKSLETRIKGTKIFFIVKTFKSKYLLRTKIFKIDALNYYTLLNILNANFFSNQIGSKNKIKKTLIEFHPYSRTLASNKNDIFQFPSNLTKVKQDYFFIEISLNYQDNKTYRFLVKKKNKFWKKKWRKKLSKLKKFLNEFSIPYQPSEHD